MNKIAIYPGSFDPITYGHLDIINRSLNFIDKLIIAIAFDNMKQSLFSIDEKIEMIKGEIAEIKNKEKIVIKAFNGLLVEFTKKENAILIIRGLRAISDFEYEFQMSCTNSKLAPEIETIFLPASEKTHFISSRMVKEVARLGGDVNGFVSSNIANILHKTIKY